MHIVGYLSLLLAFFFSVFLGIFSLFQIRKTHQKDLSFIHTFIFVFILFASLLLFYFFLKKDFSLVYVYSYTDKDLVWYYALSAFWAGQEGSLLLWLLFIAICVQIWISTKSFKNSESYIKNLFWVFVLPLETFFLSLIVTTINPFIKQIPVPQEGLGLNPLLQHPAMAFHPPLLFLGYSGFIISASMILTAWLKGDPLEYIIRFRGWILIFWSFLTAGILLGCWWSYMELGWGGYWAWDPVENSSLIPWLLCTSFLHISHVARKKHILIKSSFLLSVFIPVSCVLGSFLTRSGFLESLHTFSESKIGIPILVFLLFYILLVLFVFSQKRSKQINLNQDLPSIFSKDGIIIITNWLFLCLIFVIILGTLWPVISSLFFSSKHTVGSDFYNRTCLPIFSLIVFILMVCFMLMTNKKFWLLLFIFIPVELVLWFLKINKMLVLISMGSAISLFFTIVYLCIKHKSWAIRNLEIIGIHLGIVFVVIGIAFSSGYKISKEVVLKPKEKISIKDFIVEFKDYSTKFEKNTFLYSIDLLVKKGDKVIGELKPYKKIFKNQQSFSKVDVLPMWFNEMYVVILSFEPKGMARVEISLHPFINWFWIGGLIMCICSLVLGIRLSKKI